MKRLEIFDRSKDDFLIPLADLLGKIDKLEPLLLTGEWFILPGAYGYGELICSIEDQLLDSAYLSIRGENIFPLLREGQQYFYNVSMTKGDKNVKLGIGDSTYLYVEGKENLIEKLLPLYENTRIFDVVDNEAGCHG